MQTRWKFSRHEKQKASALHEAASVAAKHGRPGSRRGIHRHRPPGNHHGRRVARPPYREAYTGCAIEAYSQGPISESQETSIVKTHGLILHGQRHAVKGHAEAGRVEQEEEHAQP